MSGLVGEMQIWTVYIIKLKELFKDLLKLAMSTFEETVWGLMGRQVHYMDICNKKIKTSVKKFDYREQIKSILDF